MAYKQGTTIAEKIAAATMSVRLHLVEFHVPGVFAETDRVFDLLHSGLDIARFVSNPTSDWKQQSPQTPESLTIAVDATANGNDDDAIHSDAIALSIFMVGCGPTIYTRLPRHADRWFDFATSYILRSRRALMHPATGYTFGVRSILFASEPRYDLAAPYMELGLDIPWRDTPWRESSCQLQMEPRLIRQSRGLVRDPLQGDRIPPGWIDQYHRLSGYLECRCLV